MAPIDVPHSPRVVIYHQTHYQGNDFVSLLPLITEGEENVGVTHVIIAALHINDLPGNITLNDDPPDHSKFDRLWEEVALFQDIGVKVLCMIGGAAQGSFQRLDGDDMQFEQFYAPVRNVIHRHGFNGVDLDVEEEMSLGGIVRLIDRLKADFGDDFLITLAPVATALQGLPHLSGFDYEALEVMRGRKIAWYNTQFYNNWGFLQDLNAYHLILARGFPIDKVVVGVLTNPGLGNGYIEFDHLQTILSTLWTKRFGGLMGWEFFSSKPGDVQRPWEWAHGISKQFQGLQNSPR